MDHVADESSMEELVLIDDVGLKKLVEEHRSSLRPSFAVRKGKETSNKKLNPMQKKKKKKKPKKKHRLQLCLTTQSLFVGLENRSVFSSKKIGFSLIIFTPQVF